MEWGEASMLEAEQILLATALEDPFNQRFILLSDRLFLSFWVKYLALLVLFIPMFSVMFEELVTSTHAATWLGCGR